MKHRLSIGVLSSLVILILVLSACTTTTPATSTTPVNTTTASTTSSAVTPTTATSTTASTTASIPVSTTTAAQAKWWDKFGKPKYGGTIVMPTASIGNVIFDNYNFIGGGWQFWFETLWANDWTLDRNIWSFNTSFYPEKYHVGLLAESWEQPDGQTVVVHLRQGVHFQNKAPVNGREFTAYDVQSHYDRVLGKGEYTERSPYYISYTTNWESITATDKYTVVFKFKKPTGTGLLGIMDYMGLNTFEAPESVAAEGGKLVDWTKAVGTGAWMLTDFISGTSMTYSKNTDYWGHDERYPDNKLPYADELKVLVIPDVSTRMAALRTAKIDSMDMINWQQAKSMAESDPGLIQYTFPGPAGGVEFRCDKAPFTDINVRIAMQMAVDIDAIAKGYYNGTSDTKPCGLVSPAMKGYCYAYEDWPQSLKNEYSYDLKTARQLLSDAGYPNGFKTNVVVASNADVPLIELMKAQFLDVGIDMEIKMMEYSAWRSYVLAQKHDQMVSGGTGMPFPPTMIISFRDSRDKANNRTFNNDAGYDAIVDRFNAATTPDEVASLMVEADKYSLEKHWAVNLVATTSYSIWQPYLKGYSGESTGPMGGGVFWARIWLEK